jgi:hypothetical protein
LSDSLQHWRKANINGVACLVPCDEETEAWLKRRKTDSVVAMNPDHVRNAERSAIYWVVCSLVAENHEELRDREAVSDTLKTLAGLVHVWSLTLPDGEKCFLKKPRSISFAKMREDEFEFFIEKAFGLIESHLLPGVDIEELRKEAYIRSGADVSRAPKGPS